MNSDTHVGKTAVAAFPGDRVATLSRTAFLVGVVLVSPLFLSQPVTGAFVNMALVLVALLFGLRREALLVAVVPSLVALSRGQLPAAFLPIVPFIMAGNLVLVAAVSLSYRRYGNFALAAIVGSVLKAVFLAGVGSAFAVTVFAGTPLAGKVVTMFGWLQLVTALIGSALAYPLFRLFRRD